MWFLVTALIFICVLLGIFIGHYYYKYKQSLKNINQLQYKVKDMEDKFDGKSIIDDLDYSIDNFLKPTYDITIEEIYLDVYLENPSMKFSNVSITEQRKNTILEDVYNRYMNYISEDFKKKLYKVYDNKELPNIILDIMYYKLTLYVKERNDYQKSI